MVGTQREVIPRLCSRCGAPRPRTGHCACLDDAPGRIEGRTEPEHSCDHHLAVWVPSVPIPHIRQRVVRYVRCARSPVIAHVVCVCHSCGATEAGQWCESCVTEANLEYSYGPLHCPVCGNFDQTMTVVIR